MSNHVLLEIGMEELPARFIDDAQKQLKEKTVAWLAELSITYDSVTSFSTPRRLAVLIKDIASYQTTIKEEVRGPQITIAKDEMGEWTKAAVGFSKGHGKSTDDLYIKTVKDTEYIFVEKKTEGKKTSTILPGLHEVVSAIQFPQTMRWASGTFRYARPIRWLVALLDNQVIPFEIANVKTSNITYGHRFLGEQVTIDNPLAYEKMLENNYVIVDPNEREEMIVQQIKQLEMQEGFLIQVDPLLLNEVRNLVEYPTAFFGTFPKSYLQLPREALITTMAAHQRYFPVMDEQDEALLPYFVSVRNGDDQEIENVVKGNEKVLRARLADAVFFFEEDKSQSIDFYLNKLKTVVFQEKIGTIAEKTERMITLTKNINQHIGVPPSVAKQVIRTAEICKFDLMTSMVDEFPELQGIMGAKYAIYFGEEPVVAEAIKEHYYPIQANGQLPTNDVGAIVSIADKLDTIVSCISVGLIPSGSQDPYGLRRQTIGILRILKSRNWDVSVEDLLAFAMEQNKVSTNAEKDIQTFMNNRAAFLLSEENVEQDVIHAVTEAGIGVFGYTIDKAIILSAKRNDDQFKSTQEALVRVMNLGKKSLPATVHPDLFETESERQLYQRVEEVEEDFEEYQAQYDAKSALTELEKLAKPIHAFFEHNMVMADDERVKENRLALVHQISSLISSFADMTLIKWKQHH